MIRRRGAAVAVVPWIVSAGIVSVLSVSGVACGEAEQTRATLSVTQTLADTDTAGYARAVDAIELRFPADHGPHPDFKHEWWYFTGNLEAVNTDAVTSGTAPGVGELREFGFQLTFFRSALRPDTVELDSDWATRQAFMGHFALTDIDGKRFHAFERFDRGALGLAGAEGEPMRVWIGEWEAEELSSGNPATFRIRAAEDGVSIDLILRQTQPIVLQGERGLSRKGPEPGNASYYYSMMRLDAAGTVRAAGSEHPVQGTAWLDREWGTSALSPGLAGWDWFSLQLDDDSELMLYRLRTDDGGTAPFSAATFVAPDGTVTRLAPSDFVLDETGYWSSPRGPRYPSGWRIRVPVLNLDLTLAPRLPDQELDLAFRYWEGAVAVDGTGAGGPVAGKGYAELTGY